MQAIKSHNATDVINRLKKILKVKRDAQLAAVLKIRANTISTWKKRDTLDYDAIISLCESYNFDLNFVFLNNKKSGLSGSKTPLVSRDAQFQYALSLDVESKLEALPKYNFPFIKTDESRAFQVISNNMYPLIEENSYVICESADGILLNVPAVIVSRQKGIFINKIQVNPHKDDEYILSSENERYHDIIIKITEIDEIWKITGQISYDIKHENRYRFITESLKKINAYVDAKSVTH